ncbi:subtilisin-like serine protease-related [Abeliophyllum distichum]|uniref:Subtilisin-like serine protease-related n=1 Tax=Abeliophyllum distichum TaxID=126358 RepID=A0ABD1UL71_9LAMI
MWASYSTKNLRLVTGDNSTYTQANNGTVWDLNYPSFALSATSSGSVTCVFHRTVSNVGLPVSTYTAVVGAPSGLSIKVSRSVLSFKSIGQKQTFVVTIEATLNSSRLSGSLVWDDGMYRVRSPIVAYAAWDDGMCQVRNPVVAYAA